jgi:hypothetical protein
MVLLGSGGFTMKEALKKYKKYEKIPNLRKKKWAKG